MKYDFIKIIGSGSFGVVKLAQDKSNPYIKYAVKSIDKKLLSENTEGLCSLKREIQALMSVDHPNIVKLYECFEDADEFHLVMEYLEGGELFQRYLNKGVLNER